MSTIWLISNILEHIFPLFKIFYISLQCPKQGLVYAHSLDLNQKNGSINVFRRCGNATTVRAWIVMGEGSKEVSVKKKRKL